MCCWSMLKCQRRRRLPKAPERDTPVAHGAVTTACRGPPDQMRFCLGPVLDSGLASSMSDMAKSMKAAERPCRQAQTECAGSSAGPSG